MVLAMPERPFPPRHACDCHVHVIGPKARFPLVPARRYTPMDATKAELTAMLAALGLDRVVLVQPSIYGFDNACMLDAMAALPDARGVAVLPAETPGSVLDELHVKGIRGLRVNVATGGMSDLAAVRREIEAAARLCARHGWHVQIFVPAKGIEPLEQTLRLLPVDTVIDHFALIPPGGDVEALHALSHLVESGKIWVKISGAYRIADDPDDPDDPRIGLLAQHLYNANPERIVWGSDWPHTPRHMAKEIDPNQELPFQNIDTRGLLALLPHWLAAERDIAQVLVGNPAQLYGFDAKTG
jgi:predicted TIM-barrel fold metal-dependent hydrolase